MIRGKKLSIEEINNRINPKSSLKAVSFSDTIHVSISGRKSNMVKCICICGNTKIGVIGDVIRGSVSSCGCKKTGTPQVLKHSPKIYPRLYRIWSGIKRRISNKNQPGYEHYGGKGVKICKEWETDFDCFAEWALKNGYDDTKSIDKDINGGGLNYSPKDCCWVSVRENNRNRTISVKHDFNGEQLLLSEIAKKIGIKYSTLKRRYYRHNRNLLLAVDPNENRKGNGQCFY